MRDEQLVHASSVLKGLMAVQYSCRNVTALYNGWASNGDLVLSTSFGAQDTFLVREDGLEGFDSLDSKFCVISQDLCLGFAGAH